MYFFLPCPDSHCPHQNKPEHPSRPLANSLAVAVNQNPEDCPQCAASLSLREDMGAVDDSANGEEEEAVEETDGEENHLEDWREEEKNG